MQIVRRLGVMAVVMLLAVSCGGDDDASDDVATPGGGVDATTDADGSDDGDGAGSGDAGTGGGSDGGEAGSTAGGVPFPAGGRDVLAEAGLSIDSQVQLFYPQDRFDELVAYYDDYTSSLPGEVFRTESGAVIVYQVFDEGSALTATITVERDAQDGADAPPETFVFIVDGS